MCGIVGYVGNKEIIPILLEGLHSLEYRGYDSSGIAIHDGKVLSVLKSVGKLSKLEEILKNDAGSVNGKNGKNEHVYCGIGHTRWATHGEPSDINAHPHFDSDEKIAVVHNGIIRNYQEVKDKLVKSGIKFLTQTDTEVIVQLIAKYLKENNSVLSTICKTVSDLEGSYALAILFKEKPDKIYAVRKESPLVIGLGEKENYLASDSPTLSRFVDKIVRLGDNEIAEVTKEKVEFFNTKGEKINKTVQKVIKSKDFLDKRGFKHYLEKEINEQSEVISNLLNEFLPSSDSKVKFDHLKLKPEFLKNIDRILILACGTAYHSGLIAKYVFENLTSIPTEVQFASEYLNIKPLLSEKSLVIGISQSGETADTLTAIKRAVSCGATLVGITNRADSALADLSKERLLISKAGLEVSVAATKTFTAQITMLYLLAIYISEILGSTERNNLKPLKQELRLIPRLVDQTLTRAEYYQEQVLKYANKRDFVFIGRGINYPIALEAALKLKELSYIHASGYASGEMKHGPIAVLDPNVPVVSIIVPGETYDRVFQNSLEAKSRSAPMIAVTVDGDKKAESIFDTVLHVPPVTEVMSPFLTVIPMQFLAYYIAEHLGRDVDQPRNLAKSVTVE
ncbi:MAG: glutamine--fructose-6-phosphate transaminase (isomerizing) [Candidatus Melainabacteria bacterium]|nr:glutamine--fructose-6-phosphate transaminase (isomerizing) [Candidatus Melainabacteria bacterium]